VHPELIVFAVASLWALGLACAALANKSPGLTVFSFVVGMILFVVDALLALASVRVTESDVLLRFEAIRLTVMSALPAAWLAFSLSWSRGNANKFLSSWKPILVASCLLPVVPLVGFNELFRLDQALAEVQEPVVVLSWLSRGLHLAILVSAVLVLMNLERTFGAAVGTLRWRIKFVVLGLGLIFAARVYTSSQALLYSALDRRLGAVDAGALLLGCSLCTVSFFRAKLSAVQVYPSFAVLDKSLTLLLAGAYLLVVGVLAKVMVFLGGDAAFPVKAFLVLLAIMALGILLASDRARFAFRRFASRHFHRSFYDYRHLWRTFTERTSSIADERAYAREVANLISDAVQTLSVSVWIEQSSRGKMVLAASTSLPQADEHASPVELTGIAEHVARHPEPFALDYSREPWVAELQQRNPDQFQKGGQRICVPLVGKGQLLGMLIIGDRVNGIPFSFEDFELFKSVGSQAASGLLNLKLTQQLVQAKEMETFQTMSAFFIHDLKNTASAMSLMLQNLPAHFNDPAFREDALRAISKSVGRINDLIGRLTQLRQKLELQPVESDLNEVVAATLKGLGVLMEGNLVCNFATVPKVVMDPEQIQKVIVNLLLNARDAAGQAGRIHLETGQRNGWVVFSVKDNGCGMSREFLNYSLFRPFQTTKKKGIGIGMFHSKMIVDAHKGRIEVESEQDKGTIFRVLLPLERKVQ
jgi:putative PEP-CTERM system histidine kinase